MDTFSTCGRFVSTRPARNTSSGVTYPVTLMADDGGVKGGCTMRAASRLGTGWRRPLAGRPGTESCNLPRGKLQKVQLAPGRVAETATRGAKEKGRCSYYICVMPSSRRSSGAWHTSARRPTLIRSLMEVDSRRLYLRAGYHRSSAGALI